MFRWLKQPLFYLRLITVFFLSAIILFVYHYDLKSIQVWKFRFHNEFRNESIDQSQSSINGGTPEPFRILFWTQWYSGNVSGVNISCDADTRFERLGGGLSDLEKADAIIFQAIDTTENIAWPPSRSVHVPWVLAVTESSTNLARKQNFKTPEERRRLLNGQFNLTWGSVGDADITLNYTEQFEIMHRHATRDLNWEYGSAFSRSFFKNKTNLAAWVVSNCAIEPSKRSQLVDDLQTYGVNVTMRGECANMNRSGNEIFRELGYTHKFYLALENSLCHNYITEKVSHGLFFSMVPVFYGIGPDLRNRLPPNSFIDAMDFNSSKELAQHLLALDKDDRAYFKFFGWRQFYDVHSARDYLHGTFIPSCYVLKRLKDLVMSAKRKSYERMDLWLDYYRTKGGKLCPNCLSEKETRPSQPKYNTILFLNDTRKGCLSRTNVEMTVAP